MDDKKLIKDDKGQLSIFLGISLLVVITMLAFVVNVGLFVKAKINLQNAVDSAAYAGAAVQARQLSNIAYLNWEMRNNYKEWMFKYYVIGNMSLKETANPARDNLNFRMVPFFGDSESENTGEYDPYNLPSICIHFGSPHNICEIYDIPGLPRFQTVGLPSISPYHEAALDTMTKIKASNCSLRSDVNFGVAMLWAYGIGSNLFQDSPQIAASRVGAWPIALELGMRMRNLEMIVNRPPFSESPLCRSSDGCTNIETINAGTDLPLNERPLKAYMSAYRNLGGGNIKEQGDGADEFSQDPFAASFKLFELPPNPIDATGTLGEFLIPSDATIIGTGVPVLEKPYLDLWAWPINFTTFFTTFVSDTQEGFAGSDVSAEAGCKGTKTGLPVPGFLFGFSKNPNSLTYYAVKGEAKYIGLMFPFTERGGITLQAYAAAKPFGGRIGPVLFESNGSQGVKVRSDTNVGRSLPYVGVIQPKNTGNSGYVAGFPIPFDNNFFATQTDIIGGPPGSGENSKFVLPNLLYDAIDLQKQKGTGSSSILVVKDALNQSRAYFSTPEESYGLYDKKQFQSFQSNLVRAADIVMSEDEIQTSIHKVRAPTTYEAMNYMVPITYEGRDPLYSVQTVRKISNFSDGTQQYQIYAPLFGAGTIYGSNTASIEGMIADYIESSEPAVQEYLNSLKVVAESIMTKRTRGGSDTYYNAANSIHDVDPNSGKGITKNVDPANCDKISIASKFRFFFTGDIDEACQIKPLKILMRDYLNGQTGDFATYYTSSYLAPNDISLTNTKLATAYFPGSRQGVDDQGVWSNPFSGVGSDPMKRNYYSTKFVPIKKLTGEQDSFWGNTPLIQELNSLSKDEPDTATSKGEQNTLDAKLLDDFKANLEH